MAAASIVARDANNTAQNMGVLVDGLNTINYAQVGMDSTQATYRAAANFTPQATAAVTVISIQGSATKTVRIKRIGLSGVSTGAGQNIYQLQRTSALGAGGTVVAPSIALMDRGPGANYPAATAVVQHYTTTLKAAGTAVGGVITTANIQTVVTAVPTTSVSPQEQIFPEFGVPAGSAIVLRGTGDFLEIQNVAAANLAAGTVLCYFIEWVEDGS